MTDKPESAAKSTTTILSVNVKLKGKLYPIGYEIPDDIIPKGLLKYRTDGKTSSKSSKKGRSTEEGTETSEGS